MTVSKTVIISCAGMGKRLGLDTSKCLVDVAGESLIMRNLRMLDDVDDVRVVVGFSREHGQYEWTGVTQVKAEKIMNGSGHTYQLTESYLPMPYMYLRTKEIDTPDDYDRAVRWVKGGYSDEVAVGIVGGMGSYATVGFFKRLVDAFPARYEWERPPHPHRQPLHDAEPCTCHPIR